MEPTVYKGYTKDELELHFDPQHAVPNHQRWAEQRNEASLRARKSLKAFFNIPYGDSPRQVSDIFPAEKPGGPVLIYFHGGYWRSGSKDQNCHFAPLFVKAGATLVVVEYDLCPKVAVADIVREARAAIAWVYKNISSYGGDPAQLYISGLSAGGHLVAMALAHDWEKEGLPRNLIKGAAAISGVYDLDAVLHLDVNKEIRLTPESARENSPLLHLPLPHAPLLIAVGGAEPSGWQEQSAQLFMLSKERGVPCEYIEVPGAHHYSIGLLLPDAQCPLTRAMLQQMGLPAAA
ncbi:MAG TPA: alpha/beta hydrolase [Candidatus Binatia bacterium]|jgi:arylformamidase